MSNAVISWFQRAPSSPVLMRAAWVIGAGVLVTSKKTKPTHLSHALSLATNWESLAFNCTGELINALAHATERELESIGKMVTRQLRDSVGATHRYEPMYPNFPKQVMQASDAELFINAFMHYAGDVFGLRIMPLYQKQERKELKKRDIQYKSLGLISSEKLGQLYLNSLAMPTSWSPAQREVMCLMTHDLCKALSTDDWLQSVTSIPNKENLAVFASVLHDRGVSPSVIQRFITNITDVARLGIALHDPLKGDVALCGEVSSKMGSFKRPWRRMALSYIEQHGDFQQTLENMMSRRMLFVTLGEKLHPSEYASRYPKAEQAFFNIRNAQSMRGQSYNARLEAAFIDRKMAPALDLLKTRPGVFARRIVAMLCIANKKVQESIFAEFEHAAKHVSMNVLFNLLSYVRKGQDLSHSAYMPKGSVAKVFVRNELRHQLSYTKRNRLCALVESALEHHMQSLPALGKVYLNPDLRGLMMPHGLRNASQEARTMVRGSRIALPKASNIVRCFMWWKEGSERVDLDLSVVFLNEKMQMTQQCSWTNLRGEFMAHSGDITSAPKGACEFIDFNLDHVDEASRYALMVVNAYTNTKYKDLPEAFAGFMMRSKLGQRGEIFDARTVMQKFDLVSDGRVAMPMMIDLKTREYVWMDLGAKSYPSFPGTYQVENQKAYARSAVKTMATLSKPTLGEVMDLHMQYRPGTTYVASKEEADVVIDWDGSITPFDHATMSSQFMAE